MAAESGYLSILANPVEALAAAGGGDLMRGIGKLAQLARAIPRKALHNIVMVTGKDTVGADTLVNIVCHFY